MTMGAVLGLPMLAALPLTGAAPLAASPPAAAPSPTTMPLPTFDLPPGPTTTPEPARPQPQIQPQAQPQAEARPSPLPVPVPVPVPAPTSAPSPAASPAPSPATTTTRTGDPLPGAEATQPPPGEAPPTGLPVSPPELPASAAAAPNSSALGASLLPAWWPLAAGVLAGLGVMAILLLAQRIRKPRVPRLAAPAPRAADHAGADSEPAPAKLDCQLAILAATRSVMMFTIEYRLEIANRSPRAVRDLQVTARLGYPGRTGEEAALVPSAESIQTIERIGPHQSRSITGTLRLPLAEIAPIRQGASPLLIPLLHMILEGAGHPRETRLFVAGTPSPANLGRLQPIRLDTTPGGIAGVRALPVNAP
ncbi:MAG: hypothetical protein ACK4IS_06330 [Erythrobacter sp.]